MSDVGRLVVVAATTLAAAGCSTGGSNADHRPAPVAAGQPVRVLATAPLPNHVDNAVALRGNVTQTSCAATRGGWGAAGTVHNPSSRRATYRITVFFTTVHATTLDYAVATVRVGAGRTAPWTAAKRFAAQDQMLCPMPGIAVVR